MQIPLQWYQLPLHILHLMRDALATGAVVGVHSQGYRKEALPLRDLLTAVSTVAVL